MPIRPKPTSYRCHQCNWSKTVAPKSDALGPGDWFSTCPACGSAKLEQRPAYSVEVMLSTMLQRIRGL